MQALSDKNNSVILLIWLMLFIDQKLDPQLAHPRPGPASKLPDLEALTILLFDGLVEQHQTLRGVYNYIRRDYGDCFRLPTYQNFARQALRLMPQIVRLLKALLAKEATVFADSTPLAVCRPIRANHYRTLSRKTVGFSRNLMSYFFGFKLHLAIDNRGQLAGFHLSKASHLRPADTPPNWCGPGPRPWWETPLRWQTLVAELAARGVRVVSNTNKSPVAADRLLLGKRSLVESVFGTLKGKYQLVSSYCRSKAGHMLHYLRVLLGYRWARCWPELANSRLALTTL